MTVKARSTDGEDRRLIAHIAAGDRAAFETFYHAYSGRVLAFVSGLVFCPALAEEVASDAMIAVWRSAARYGGRSRVVSWVLGIAHHKAIDALRRQGQNDVALELLPALSHSALEPDDDLLRAEDRFALDAALRALSAEHRTVLLLMFGFDFSQTEIAAIVECPVATVKTRVFYAKRRLRIELDRAAAAEEIA